MQAELMPQRTSLRLLSKRQLDFECVAVESLEVAAVHARDAARVVQAQARARLAGLGRAAPAIEPLEQVRGFI